MRGWRWAAYCWPGLASLWLHGSWIGLAVAVAFAILLQCVLVATWVWDAFLGDHLSASWWSALGAAWLVLVLISLRFRTSEEEPKHDAAQDRFAHAMTEYLRCNWLDAENIARRLLVERAGDIEAGLLLAAVLRRTSRFDEAREVLDELTHWDRATDWQLEIDKEYRILAEKERDLKEERNMQSEEPVTIPLPNLREAA